MKNIAVVTGTRAEYGLLKNIMIAIDEDKELNLQLIVTGMHLSEKYGLSVRDIIKDGFKIDEEIPILVDTIEKNKNALEMGKAVTAFAKTFQRLKPDILLVLGDRYEVFAAASTAMLMGIAIAHIAGGEVTEGAMDDQIRHAITKMAHIHFPGAQIYADNIKRMGEESFRIHNVGDSGIENIKLTTLMSKEELSESLNMNVDENTLLITYHPVTLEYDDIERQIDNLIIALDKVNKKMIITYPNSDNGSDKIIVALEKFASNNTNVHLYKNLGSLRYLSAMNICEAVIGNSSSALIEAPFLKKPVVNIGNRQRGRLMADNVIQCGYDVDEIFDAINKAISYEFKDKVKNVKSLYGEGNTSEEIVKILKNTNIDDKLLMKKLSWD
ncbi:MAG: UDP-N-acetylglucosamine 2-epimerase (hydrolyzing) [Clostridiales bacterium]|nr:UDP-N-acetylglucosamine 2-epimerase (hydrolyzing) [Clostridiales bacterium]